MPRGPGAVDMGRAAVPTVVPQVDRVLLAELGNRCDVGRQLKRASRDSFTATLPAGGVEELPGFAPGALGRGWSTVR
jgi:hypothetical protein